MDNKTATARYEVYEVPNTFSRRSLAEQIADGSCDWIAEAIDGSGIVTYGHTEAEAIANFSTVTP